MSPEFMELHSQYIDKFGDGFNTVVMSDDEEKALITKNKNQFLLVNEIYDTETDTYDNILYNHKTSVILIHIQHIL